ncbi:Aste57867_12941 [Aphanomyces stellatus]|uniref:Aste57867_12941 protein n=1 Tax=Aphanomyces stellatus TaxID=120398 RepID=A0A485KX88_9STRA|nr:hypothetical protein As57867_012893 [Aphanomyces stellatus]VFT89787.1 Aste57867_12941 [Aphanomyces stellatus]
MSKVFVGHFAPRFAFSLILHFDFFMVAHLPNLPSFEDGHEASYVSIATPMDKTNLVDPALLVDDGARKEGGALRAGDAPVYTSSAALALFAQYACIGFVKGGFDCMTFPILNIYFALEANTLLAAIGLMQLGWSLKIFYGILSDCYPIGGYSRKPYILLGWVSTAICLLVLAFKPAGEPSDASSPAAAAQARGSTLALLCALACLCYIMADVTCDALVVEYAQREPLSVRGRLQATTSCIRYIFAALIAAVAGVGLNSRRFGGSFDFDMGVNGFFQLLALPCVLNVPVVWFYLEDPTKKPRVPLGPYLASVVALLQTRVVCQVMAFQFLFALFTNGIRSTAAAYVQVYWAHVEPLNFAIYGILGSLLLALAMAIVARWGTRWNWRWMLVTSTLAVNAVDAAVQYLVVFDVVRSQWFYLGVPLVEFIPFGVQMMFALFVVVELADVGNEGLVYGLLTTISSVAVTCGTMITNIYCSQFRVAKDDIQSDTAAVRHDVALTYAIMYGTTVFACVWVVFLPPQKEAVAELKLRGGSYPLVGTVMIIAFFAILILSITSTLLSMFPSTACLILAGGTGCP